MTDSVSHQRNWKLQAAGNRIETMTKPLPYPPPWQDMATLCDVPERKDDHDRGYVYFIRCGDLVKIGFSASPETRLRTLRATSAAPLIVLGTSYAHKKLERRLHKQFAYLRHHGEWFRRSAALDRMIQIFI